MKKNCFAWLAALMLLMPVGANAQFGGGLKKLKQKAENSVKNKVKEVKQDVKNTVNNAVTDLENQVKDELQSQADDALNQVMGAVGLDTDVASVLETAAMPAEQKWAVKQLKNLDEAPELPNLMKLTEDAYSGGTVVPNKLIKDFTEVMGKASHDQVVKARASLDERLAYNVRIMAALKTMNDVVPKDNKGKGAAQLQQLKDEVAMFDCIQTQVRFNLSQQLGDIRKRNGVMSLNKNDMLYPPRNAKCHNVRKNANGKCRFYDNEKRKFITIDKEEVARVQDIVLNYLDNAITLMELNPQLDEYNKAYYPSYDPQEYNLDQIEKCKLAKQCIQEALANNGK